MLKINLYNVLISPLITEKNNIVMEKSNHIVFKVLKQATKNDVKAAFQLLYNVRVKSVRILNVHGKEKKFGRFYGSRNNSKKAYIKLSSEQNFDLNAIQK